MDDLVKQKNRELCERYPFLIPWNRWSGVLITEAENGGFYPGEPEVVPEYDWDHTELDAMPTGWRKAFGEQMCEEIRQALIEDDDLDRWRIVQLKEKYGSLCLYDNGYKPGSRVPEIIDKYSRMSERICVQCGKPATRITSGWICPYCDECCPDGRSVPIDEWFKEDETDGW